MTEPPAETPRLGRDRGRLETSGTTETELCGHAVEVQNPLALCQLNLFSPLQGEKKRNGEE